MAYCRRCGNPITKEVRRETMQNMAKMLLTLKTKIKKDSSLDPLEFIEKEYLIIRERIRYS